MAGEPQPLGLADMTAEEAVQAVEGLSPWLLDAAEAEETAGKNRKSVQAAIAKQRPAPAPAQEGAPPPAASGPTYSADELAVVAEARFGVPADVIRGAFMAKGVSQLPLEEAQALVAEYAQYRPPIPGQQQEA